MACAGGRVDCVRLLLEEHGADHNAKDLENRSALDILKAGQGLCHEIELVQDIVERLTWKDEDDKTKDDARYRARRGADGGDVLKGWVLKFPGEGLDGLPAIMTGHRDGEFKVVGAPVKLLDLAVCTITDPQLDVITGAWMPHSVPIAFNDDVLNDIEFVRRATPVELEQAGVDKDAGLEVQSGFNQISVRYSDVNRNTDYTVYAFDVYIGNDCVHSISDRYSVLEKKYSKLGQKSKKSIDSDAGEQIVRFPSKQNKFAAKMSESTRQKAEVTRKADLKHFFEAILGVEEKTALYASPAERIIELEEVHKLLEMSAEVSKRLVAASVNPNFGAAANSNTAPVTRETLMDSVRLDRNTESNHGVREELEKASAAATNAHELNCAAAMARHSKAILFNVPTFINAVMHQQLNCGIMEKKRTEAGWSADYYQAHQRASTALKQAKDSIAQEKYVEACAQLKDGLDNPLSQQHVAARSPDAGMLHRWDLEVWLKVAGMRTCMQDGVVSDSVKVLEQNRVEPKLCWSLDVSGGVGLIDAVQEAFKFMGVGQDSGGGMLQNQRDALIIDIETMVDITQQHVDEINGVLDDLHNELLRLAEFPVPMVADSEPEPEADEPQTLSPTISLTQQQIDAMSVSYRQHWPSEGLDGTITVQELGEIMEELQGHHRPSEVELKTIDVHSTSDICLCAHPCGVSPCRRAGTVDYSNYLKLCSKQVDTADRELLEVFQIFDADGDGKITAPELRRVLNSYSQPTVDLSDTVIDEMMREGDTNGDAHIDFAEFKAMMRRNYTDLSELESTLLKASKLSGRSDNVHHNLPALHSATQAVSAISRFCGYAACAKASPYAEDADADGAIELESTCAGAELWSFSIVMQIIAGPKADTLKLPTVSFALAGSVLSLPDEADVNADLETLVVAIDSRMEELVKELERRSCVRTNTAAGRAALSRRKASEAVRQFEQASAVATEIERAQLRECLERSNMELKRQQEVKRLQSDAIEALTVGNGARTAVAKYAAALRSEVDETTFEHDALREMHALAQSWVAGDDALAQWQGLKALSEYQKAAQTSLRVATIIPTDGYDGVAIRLGGDAKTELQNCIVKAEDEIRRKNNFVKTKDTAEKELERLRAEAAKATFDKALVIAAGGPEVESTESKDGIDRSQEELARQKEAKSVFSQAMTVIGSTVPTKEWEENVVEKWTELSECVEDAIDRCTEAMRSVCSQAGCLKSQEQTPEHKALTHMTETCNHWKAGAEHMADYKGKEALKDFQSAGVCAQKAWILTPTDGYHGRPFTLTEEAQVVLAACVSGANSEIARNKKGKKLDAARKSMMNAGQAGAALQEAKKRRAIAKTADEIAAADREIESAEEKTRNQEKVKEIHKSALKSLNQNDPVSALAFYNAALGIETLEGGLSEAKSLQQMKLISSIWIEGNAALQVWDGKKAMQKFKQCRETEKHLDTIVPTAGYAGSKILVGRATGELQRCEERAQNEASRNHQFASLIEEGNNALDEWRAERALECFKKADDKDHARFSLKYQVLQVEKVRPGKAEELDIAAEAIARAVAEVARQHEVKDSFAICVQALEENTAADRPKEFDKNRAKERCAGAATTRAAEACEEAIAHASSEKQFATKEYSALESIQGLIKAWKKGDEHLAAWDGTAALDAYRIADIERGSAAETMQVPTAGYVKSSSAKIQLSTNANDALQRCIEEANSEIMRKNRFDKHIKAGKNHLDKLQATQAHGRFTQADKEKMNGQEHDLATNLLDRSNMELKRQQEVKRSFFAARDSLESPLFDIAKPRTPSQDRDLLKRLDERHAMIGERIAAAIAHVLSDEGDLKSQQGQPEHRALQMMQTCAEWWRAGDMALASQDGVAARDAMQSAHKCATQAKEITATPGYAGEKIELDASVENALDGCIQSAYSEIFRKKVFDAMIVQGDDLKGDKKKDRSAAHLMKADAGKCDVQLLSLRSKCRHADCKEPKVAHAGMCSECMSCSRPLAPSMATVHSLDAAKIYASAYGQAIATVEKVGAIESMLKAVTGLEEMLALERAAYTSLGQQARQYFDHDAHDETLGAQRRECERGAETTLAALQYLAGWRVTDGGDADPQRITADRIGNELQEAVTALAAMHKSNDAIREMDRQKIKSSSATDDAGAQGGLDTFEEGDEEEEDSEGEDQFMPLDSTSPGAGTTKLDRTVNARNEQRHEAINLGHTYSATAERLVDQNVDLAHHCRDVRLGLLGLRRLRRHLSFFGQGTIENRRESLLRAWIVAGASEELEEGQSSRLCQFETLKRNTAELKIEKTVKYGTFRSKNVTVLQNATVILNGVSGAGASEDLTGAVLVVTTHPSAEDMREYKEVTEIHRTVLDPTTEVEAEEERTVDTRKGAVDEITTGADKGKIKISFGFKVGTPDKGAMRLVANSNEERLEWIEKIKRKVALLRAGAQLDLIQPAPEPEEQVTVEIGCLLRCQEKASAAIEKFQLWEASLDHAALHKVTDARVAALRAQIDTCTQDDNWISSAKALASSMERCLDDLIEEVRAERGLRELRPMDSLRAALWGVGEHFPQLSQREVIDTSGRYLKAQDRYDSALLRNSSGNFVTMENTAFYGDSVFREAQHSFRDIADQVLRTAVLRLVGDPAALSFFELASSSSKLLRYELASVKKTSTRARDENLKEEVDGANAAETDGMPDTSEFDRLEEQRCVLHFVVCSRFSFHERSTSALHITFSVKLTRTLSSGFNEGTFGTTAHVNVVRSRYIQKEEFEDALHVKSKLEDRADRYDTNHKNYPPLEERQQVCRVGARLHRVYCVFC